MMRPGERLDADAEVCRPAGVEAGSRCHEPHTSQKLFRPQKRRRRLEKVAACKALAEVSPVLRAGVDLSSPFDLTELTQQAIMQIV